MKQIFVSTAFAMAFAVMAVGCASETTEGSGEFGSVGVNLLVGDTDVKAVSFELVCDSGFALNGQFNVNDEQDPPIWAAIMDVPVPNPETGEPCSIVLIASDDAGNVLCTGEQSFVVEVSVEPVKVDVVLLCGEEGDDPLGNIDIDATFEIVEGNNCPRLHFLNVVPDEVPPQGSEVTVLVSDADGDPVSTALTATGGSFIDPSAQSTTYRCLNATGTQTVSVIASDGDSACDKTKSFVVTCPGVGDPCDGKDCDAGNLCIAAECNQDTGDCETSNVGSGVECALGELTTNGGFELGNLDFWTLFCESGSCEATDAEANGGSFSGRVSATGGPANPLIKQANIGVGLVEPNSPVTVSVDIKGTAANGGVVFAEFFSEVLPSGTSKNEFVANAVLPTDTWTTYTLETTTGPDVSNGVTLQLVAVCGAVEGCTVDAFFDNASVVFGSGAGTCDGQGTCVPSAAVCVDPIEDCTPTGNECIDPVCNAGVCDTSFNTDPCNDNTGTCDAGQCVPNALALYAQDFEPPMDPLNPNALIEDTAAEVPLGPWFFFGAVFDGTQDPPAFSFGFGPFGAPNATADIDGQPPETFISAVVTGEGDGPQGDQQLSVFSDYNCCTRDIITGELQQGHGLSTDLVEINVFQELNPIPNAFIGQTVTFSFDAKRGNIEGATTAVGFIKTLDPANNFALTNFPTVDMTSIPATWNRYEVTLDLTDPALEGQILQIGFQNTAGNFEGSGIFYDNVVAELTPTP